MSSHSVKETMNINCYKTIGRYLKTGPARKNDKISRMRNLSENFQIISLVYLMPRNELKSDGNISLIIY